MSPSPAMTRTLEAIHAHHVELATKVADGVRRLHDAVEQGRAFTGARDALAAVLKAEVLPHAEAEETTLYAAGASDSRTGLLVDALEDEHRRLATLVDHLVDAPDPLTAAEFAGAVRVLFDAHLAKENDFLLPTLVARGADLPALLAGMREILGENAATAGA
jgi:hypothetical protein